MIRFLTHEFTKDGRVSRRRWCLDWLGHGVAGMVALEMRRARVLAMSLYGGLVASDGPLPFAVGRGLVLFCVLVMKSTYSFTFLPLIPANPHYSVQKRNKKAR